MTRDSQFVEDEPSPRFRVQVNGVMQEGGFDTYDEARASVKRLDVNVEIFDGTTRVFGKPLPDHPPRPKPKRHRGR